MLSRLMEQENKPIKQVVAESALKRGAPLEGGAYFVDVQKNYDGINAVIEPMEKDFEDIAEGQMFNRIPTVLGERYATTELTKGSLVVGKPLKVEGNKFVEATASDPYEWIYDGEYANPYGLTMYIVEKVPAGTAE